jgi:hypothetical protein
MEVINLQFLSKRGNPRFGPRQKARDEGEAKLKTENEGKSKHWAERLGAKMKEGPTMLMKIRDRENGFRDGPTILMITK